MKCLLGDGPYKIYRDIRAGVLEKIKAGVKNADQLQDQLKNQRWILLSIISEMQMGQNEHLVLLMTKISKFLSSFIRINLQEN